MPRDILLPYLEPGFSTASSKPIPRVTPGYVRCPISTMHDPAPANWPFPTWKGQPLNPRLESVTMRNIDQIVFVIEGQGIIEGPIRSFTGYIEETTTPLGVLPKIHVRGRELWTWGHKGQFPRMLDRFESEEMAVAAMEDAQVDDFWASDILAFRTRDEAEQALSDLEAA
jgi:hypothetical protein